MQCECCGNKRKLYLCVDVNLKVCLECFEMIQNAPIETKEIEMYDIQNALNEIK